MAVFTISDPHLSHSCDKPMDVFGGRWTNYTQKLEEYWRYMVDPQDTVVIPGDISWGMTLEEATADFQFLESLPGKKILLKGNHDYWWPTTAKLNEYVLAQGFQSLNFLYNNAYLAENKIICGTRGWLCEDRMGPDDLKVLAREAQRFAIGLEQALSIKKQQEEKGQSAELIAFFHYPVLTATARENPLIPLLKQAGIQKVYYGHLHNVKTNALPTVLDGIRYTLVSCDAVDFTPVRID